ncbi:MAG: metal ABC transporter permease [Desulfurispora sp.]|uniref:metal ABC transporter permease n=1 Tax=Desulfurispora sp. TaxID=3014275 RepID=UPI00404AFCA2
MSVLDYAFMQHALLAGLICAIVCPAAGLFITLRRLSLLADALAHICLAGVAAGLLAGFSPLLSAALFATGGAVGLELLREKYRHHAELAIAIMLSAGMAVGAILLSQGQGLNANVLSYFFGSIITIGTGDLKLMLLLCLPLLVLIYFLWDELFFITFDEENARLSGLPVRTLNIIFTSLTALTIAAAIRLVGILLVSSLMVLPVATAMQLSGSFRQTFTLSVLLAQAAVLAGLLFSFYFNLAPGGSIILCSIGLLLGTLGIKQASRRSKSDLLTRQT